MHSLNPERQYRVLSIGVCQTAAHERHLDFGGAIGRAIQESDRRVVLLAAGGLSHHSGHTMRWLSTPPRTLGTF